MEGKMIRIFWIAAFVGVISLGFQLYDDGDNPQLSGGQKFGRALTAGFTASSAVYAGGAIGSAILPVPVVGSVAGAVIGFGLWQAAELWANPLLFETFGLVPKYHRVPLQ